MRKFTLLVLLIILLILAVSCKKVNLLAPSYIPQETKFRFPTDTIPKKLDVKPKEADEVFGSFIRKFQYKGQWYILAEYIYKYDPTNKTLTQNGYNALLKLDNGGNLTVEARNLDYGSYYAPDVWAHLQNFNIIDDSQVWYENYNFGQYSFTNYRIGDLSKASGSYLVAMLSNNLSYHSQNLLYWYTQGKEENIAMMYPLNYTWQGPGYWEEYINVYFKGKLYVLGGGKGQPVSSSRNFDNIKVINWPDNPSYGSTANNWSFYNAPDKSSFISVYFDEDKIYMEVLGNYYWQFLRDEGNTKVYTPSRTYYSSSIIYSTVGVTNKQIVTYDKDGKQKYTTTQVLEWNRENSIPQSAKYVSYRYYGPLITPHTTTPDPPNWVYDDKNQIYYKASSEYGSIYLNGKSYPIPIPPYNEIEKAINRGETNFKITDEHIKNSGKNHFMLTTVNPTSATEDDWKLITPLEYTGYSMIWQAGAGNYIFNLNGKIYQLLDYYNMQDFLKYTSSQYSVVISELRKQSEEYRTIYEKNLSDKYYLKYAMYYEAQADILEAIFKKGGYIKPDDTITHYEIEFRNH